MFCSEECRKEFKENWTQVELPRVVAFGKAWKWVQFRMKWKMCVLPSCHRYTDGRVLTFTSSLEGVTDVLPDV